jgi:hypothetical protein
MEGQRTEPTQNERNTERALQLEQTISKVKVLKPTEQAVSVKTEIEWMAQRAKQPCRYGYTPDGNLRTDPLTNYCGDVEAGQSIVLATQIRSSAQRLQDAWKAKQESLKEPAKEFAAARRSLQALAQAYTKDPLSVPLADLLAANQRTRDAECVLSERMKGRRYVLKEETQIKELTFDWYRREKTDCIVLKSTVLPLTALYQAESSEPKGTKSRLGRPLPTAAQLAAKEEAPAAPLPQEPKPKRNLTPQQIAIIRARNAKR